MSLFRRLIGGLKPGAAGSADANTEYPLEQEEKLARLHSRADVRRHLEILHGDYMIGGERFVELFLRCLERTATVMTPFTVFQRFQTRRDITRYFLETLHVPGARGECGTYRGATALLLCHARASREPGYQGEGFYLIDSFSGTSDPGAHDLISVREADGKTRQTHFFTPGKTDIDAELVRGHFTQFPEARICAGWVPAVFAELPDEPWAFVHIDLTLYEPTLAALKYFYPRLSKGGVIICTGSGFCPGVQKAVDEFAGDNDLGYVFLGYAQRIFMKP